MVNKNLVSIIFSGAALVGGLNSNIVEAASNDKYSCEDSVSGLAYNNYKLRNNRVGGFVADTANLEESATLGRAAEICGYADVQGGKVIGSGIVGGEATMLSGRVMAEAYLGGDAVLNGATLKGHSKMTGGVLGKGVVLDGWYVHSSGSLSPGVYTAQNPQIAIDNANRNAKKLRDKANRDAKLIKDRANKKIRDNKNNFKNEIINLRFELDSLLDNKIPGFMIFGKRSNTPCLAGYTNGNLMNWINFEDSSVFISNQNVTFSSPEHYRSYNDLKNGEIAQSWDDDNGSRKSVNFNASLLYDDSSKEKIKNLFSSIKGKCKNLKNY